MKATTDWASLWRELVLGPGWNGEGECPRGDTEEVWRRKSRAIDGHARRKAAARDPIRDLVLSRVDRDTTVLDIGAGTGKWVVPLAPRVRHVTALDPSPTMLAVLRENVAAGRLENVRIVEGSWPETDVEPHDVTICSHAVYGVPDLKGFVRRMVEVTRRTCFLVLKAPLRQALMAEAARHVWGRPYDGPCFAVAYNVLLEMDIVGSVLADPDLWEPWTHSSLDEALTEAKRRLRIRETSRYDGYLMGLLREQLVLKDGRYVWPRSLRSVLVYWDVER